MSPQSAPYHYCEEIDDQCKHSLCNPLCLEKTWECKVGGQLCGAAAVPAGLTPAQIKASGCSGFDGCDDFTAAVGKQEVQEALCAQIKGKACGEMMKCCDKDSPYLCERELPRAALARGLTLTDRAALTGWSRGRTVRAGARSARARRCADAWRGAGTSFPRGNVPIAACDVELTEEEVKELKKGKEVRNVRTAQLGKGAEDGDAELGAAAEVSKAPQLQGKAGPAPDGVLEYMSPEEEEEFNTAREAALKEKQEKACTACKGALQTEVVVNECEYPNPPAGEEEQAPGKASYAAFMNSDNIQPKGEIPMHKSFQDRVRCARRLREGAGGAAHARCCAVRQDEGPAGRQEVDDRVGAEEDGVHVPRLLRGGGGRGRVPDARRAAGAGDRAEGGERVQRVSGAPPRRVYRVGRSVEPAS